MAEQERLMQQEEEWFDLMPIEKRLISYSLGLGIVLLLVLLWISHTIV
ncbi:MAG: hypothetical protein PWR22_1542 [Moorella sp. (in: firmicutes)]|jgi:polyferredoxin|nr:hypothetical protein [Moorella sp. E308F]MDK2816913.1 hypothetical protein [Moorella sp. (in: firmicutes)]MDK2894658.1 hypothetical protein [Moorella sp. (in: firmicutes)]GEA16068.1 hypothetical protein E308F_23120 [Moorella sp. E308F]